MRRWFQSNWRAALPALTMMALVLLAPLPSGAHGPLDHEIARVSAQILSRPADAGLLDRRARLYLALGQCDAALEDARSALAANPTLCEARYTLARALYGLRAPDASLQACDRFLACRPGDTDGAVLRARTLALLGRDPEAVRAYDGVIETSPAPTPDVYLERARAQVRMGADAAARRGLADGLQRLGAPVALVVELADMDGAEPPNAIDAGVRATPQPVPHRAAPVSAPAVRNASTPRFAENPPDHAAVVTPVVTRGPYLHAASDTSVVVRWRTDVASDARVRYGATPGSTTFVAVDATVTTEHEVTITGLTPESLYYYAVGSTSGDIAGGDATHYFRSHPVPGSRRPVRIWAIGDSGEANLNARNVRDAYLAWPGADMTDVWLMLGDNAYTTGLDTEYQAAVFDTYPQLLRNTVLWPTRGNHDVLHAGPDNDYYEIFTMPTAGESGGLASGTEAYYSFDFANVHFICLDSHGSDRSPGGAMATWLTLDLAATTREWVVAYWHHPPYTKGSHDSDDVADSGGRMTDMRMRMLPILEQGGVDLILGGHSHSYERSFLLNGHYGVSSTLSANHRIDDGDGNEQGDGAYLKPSVGRAANEGTVYAVAGSSSKTSGGTLDHPVMITSLNQLGSLVIDIDGNRLDARFLDDDGSVRDVFTLRKGLATTAAAPAAALRLGVVSENPFRSTLRFQLDTPDPGQVTLSVYDVRGRRVATLSAGPRGAGTHFVTWDGRNSRGEDVAPGVYFGVLDHAGRKRVQKLVRIR